ncbi:MAG TPA: hypothetical protein VNO52_13265 [Methylomirabilota bacterium]|nr:hypothetical protein [Methylomirabilota bacterium]
MTKSAKTFLALSLVCLAAGFTGPGSAILWGFLKPLGAIFFILFFITNLLAEPIAQFNEEAAARKSGTSAPTPPSARRDGDNGRMTVAPRAA